MTERFKFSDNLYLSITAGYKGSSIVETSDPAIIAQVLGLLSNEVAARGPETAEEKLEKSLRDRASDAESRMYDLKHKIRELEKKLAPQVPA